MPDLPIVLIVEDDVSIQRMVEDALEEGGYETASTIGRRAVTLLQGKVLNYRALVTDINLQGRMTGWDVARKARELHPAFSIVYMTGGAAEDWGAQGVPSHPTIHGFTRPLQRVSD